MQTGFFKILILSFMSFSLALQAQDESGANNKFRSEEDLSLTVGLPYDKKLDFLPNNADYKGDFKNCVKLSVSAEVKTLRFTPNQVGTCTLSIYNDRNQKVFQYRIVVKKSNLYVVAREIKSLLSEIEGIEIKIVNNRVVVDGQVLLPRDMSRIYSVVKEYGDQASMLVTLSPVAQKKIAQFIEKDINNGEIHVRAVNNKFILEGYAVDLAEKQRAEIIAKTYVPDEVIQRGAGDVIKVRKNSQVVINLITVKTAAPPEPGKIIQVVVHYVELKKDYERGFSFGWTPTIGDNTNISFSSGSRESAGVVSQITGTISNLLPKLNWAKAHGYARVLQSTSIIVQDGKKGLIKSMTRVPYQTVGADGLAKTDFEEAGISTNVTPQIIGAKSDSIQLSIEFVIKALLGMTSEGPLVSNSNINTEILVRSGQSAAIGGLVSTSSGTNYNKLPKGVAGNPLISLYSSKAFHRDQSQFVVFITPVIKQSASEGSEAIKQKFRLMN